MDASQERMEAMLDTAINAMQERMEAAITSTHSEFDKPINNRVEDVLVFTDHWNHTLRGSQYRDSGQKDGSSQIYQTQDSRTQPQKPHDVNST
jgi:hypothetical protein